MKITCDNCGAVYRIPEEKLTKDVSKATCKKCGSKLIIRRPGQDGEGDEGGGGSESDSIINHEERTVIAQVPELQKFDATTNAAGVFGTMPGNSTAAPPSSGRSSDDGRKPATPPSMVKTQPTAPVSAPKPAATMTSVSSPTPPSGAVNPVASSLGAVGQAAPSASAAPSAPKPTVVDAFTKPVKSGPEVVFEQPTSKVPMFLMGAALLGVLLFIDKGLWGLTRLTAVGFFIAIYCILAAFLAELDLSRSGKVNYVKVFLIPAVVTLGILAALWQTQGKEVAFLHPEIDVALVKEFIASLPTAPEAERESKADLSERIQAAMKTGRVRTRSGSGVASAGGANANAGGDGLDLSGLTRADAGNGDAPSMKADVGAGGLVGSGPADLNTGWSPTSRRHDVPTVPSVARAAEVNFDDDGIRQAFDRSKAESCLDTAARGMTLPSRLEVRIKMSPSGKVERSEVKDALVSGSSLEKCMQDRLARTSFPSFEAAESQWYNYAIIR